VTARAASTRRVVVTAVGIVSALGIGLDENRRRLLSGEGGIGPVTLFDPDGCRSRTAGEVPSLPPAPWRRFRAEGLDRGSHLLHHAFGEALAAGGLAPGDGTLRSVAVAVGTSVGGMISGERYHERFLSGGRPPLRLAADYLPHVQVHRAMADFGLSSVPVVFADACASGANAVGHAFRAVRSGESDAALAGGYDPLSAFVFAGFNSLQALSTGLCRPFDRERDGLVLGEGAAVLLLEEREAALARGAAILGEIAGYGFSGDAFHMTRPDPEGRGAEAAMRGALSDAGADPECVGYVNAHGTGTPFNDAMEAKAIRSVLGGRADRVPVSSTKAMTGHVLGGAGAIEAVFTLLALAASSIPPNLNYAVPDPECPVRVASVPEAAPGLSHALSNSFGFGGTNASLLLRAHEGGAR
jgi:3-oxoacyl-[acyl-carrier-protein] synthase II